MKDLDKVISGLTAYLKTASEDTKKEDSLFKVRIKLMKKIFDRLTTHPMMSVPFAARCVGKIQVSLTKEVIDHPQFPELFEAYLDLLMIYVNESLCTFGGQEAGQWFLLESLKDCALKFE